MARPVFSSVPGATLIYQRTPAPTTYQIGCHRKSLGFPGGTVAVRGTLPSGGLGGDDLLWQELVDLNAEACGDAHAELEVGTAEVAQLARDDRVGFGASDALHRGDDVVDQMLPRGVGQHVAEEISGLRVVIVVARSVAVVPVSHRRAQGERWLFVALVDRHTVEAIRPVVRATAPVTIGPHEAV